MIKNFINVERKANIDHIENKSFLPFFVSTVLVLLVIFSLIRTNQWDNVRITVVSLLVWITWICLYIFEKMKGRHIANDRISRVVKIIISVMISLFLAYTIWFSHYLTLDPLGMNLNGRLHHDTLFHASIAESIKNYGYPSILINNAGYIHYHHGSHHILSVLSSILEPILKIV